MKTPCVTRLVRLIGFVPALPALLQAHPGHSAGSDGVAGLVHVLSSVDHLLAIASLLGLGIAVGFWVRRLLSVAPRLGGGRLALLALGRLLTRFK